MFTKPTITICSDASYRKFNKKRYASWACYIRTPTTTIKTSGLIKEEVKGSTHAEMRGVANALYLADQVEDLSKFRVIVYCDNLKALQRKVTVKHTPRSKYYAAEKEKKDWHDTYIRKYIDKCKEYETRHVKGHLPKSKWSSTSKRHYMNDWCDQESKRVLRDKIASLKNETVDLYKEAVDQAADSAKVLTMSGALEAQILKDIENE